MTMMMMIDNKKGKRKEVKIVKRPCEAREWVWARKREGNERKADKAAIKNCVNVVLVDDTEKNTEDHHVKRKEK